MHADKMATDARWWSTEREIKIERKWIGVP
jgi:hypothetical protein